MPLPPLAFGHADSALTSDLVTASETMAKIVPSMKLSPAAKSKDFRTRVATCAIGDVRFLAHAATPCRMEVEESKGWHLIAPYIGTASLQCDGKVFDLRSGVSSLLLPNMRRSTERAPSSVTIASIDSRRLQETMATMSGRTGEITELAERPITLHFDGKIDLFRSFLKICSLIDATRGPAGLGEILGVDDMIYRWITVALESAEHPENQGMKGSAASSLDPVCDLIRSTHDRPLTLSEMEEASCLSARALQYAFKERFGCSPMEWQRRERMLTAQQRLMNLGVDETITQVAHAMGFSSSAAFATLYKRYFGEMPSETVAQFR